MRSVEKALAKGWSFGVKRIEGDWRNKRVEVEMESTPQKLVKLPKTAKMKQVNEKCHYLVTEWGALLTCSVR
jgi:hypothetical protein